MPDFRHKYLRRAAKPHQCCKCPRIIKEGELHAVYEGRRDGKFFRDRECSLFGAINVIR